MLLKFFILIYSFLIIFTTSAEAFIFLPSPNGDNGNYWIFGLFISLLFMIGTMICWCFWWRGKYCCGCKPVYLIRNPNHHSTNSGSKNPNVPKVYYQQSFVPGSSYAYNGPQAPNPHQAYTIYQGNYQGPAISNNQERGKENLNSNSYNTTALFKT